VVGIAAIAREGIDLDVSTLADWVGAVAASLQPLIEADALPVQRQVQPILAEDHLGQQVGPSAAAGDPPHAIGNRVGNPGRSDGTAPALR
jgi:hypothetical protein